MTLGPPRFRRKTRIGGDVDPEVFCADEQDVVPVDVSRWQDLARKVLSAEGVRGGTELSVFFIAEADMAELNREHMGADGSTDVLSFPIDGGEVVDVVAGPSGGSRAPDRSPVDRGDLPLLLGDVVICPEVAAVRPIHTPETSMTNSRCSWFTASCTSSAGITPPTTSATECGHVNAPF